MKKLPKVARGHVQVEEVRLVQGGWWDASHNEQEESPESKINNSSFFFCSLAISGRFKTM